MCPEIFDNSLSPLCHLGQPPLLNTGRPKPFVLLFAGKGKEGSSNNSFTTAVNNPRADRKRNEQEGIWSMHIYTAHSIFSKSLSLVFHPCCVSVVSWVCCQDEIYGQSANKPQWGDKIESDPGYGWVDRGILIWPAASSLYVFSHCSWVLY